MSNTINLNAKKLRQKVLRESCSFYSNKVLPISQFLYSLNYRKRSIVAREKTLNIAKNLTQKGVEFVTANDIYSRLSNIDITKECHIMASGWSLNKTWRTIPKDAFAIGFNFAALAPVSFDLYFTELASDEPGYVSEISEMQRKLIETVVLPNTPNVFFKNIWKEKNSYKAMLSAYGNKLFFLYDYNLPKVVPKFRQLVIDDLCYVDFFFLKQVSSTVVTCIVLADTLGFKKTIVHGLDFSGPHFYKCNDYDATNKNLIPPMPYDNNVLTQNKVTHKSSTEGIGLPFVVKEIKNKLAENGHILYAASEKSPSSQILPVWKKCI